MIYRPQRGSLEDSMKDAHVIFPATKEKLAKVLDADVDDVDVHPYLNGRDGRIGWENTYLVTYRGWPVGFTDTEVK